MVDYGSLTVDDLKSTLAQQNLPKSGIKSDLIRRLTLDDMQECPKQIRRQESFSVPRRPSNSKDREQDLQDRIQSLYLPIDNDPGGATRELNITVAYDTEIGGAINARKQQIEKANARYENEAEKAIAERDNKLRQLREEVKDRTQKEREFGLAIRELNDLTRANGARHYRSQDFYPDRPGPSGRGDHYSPPPAQRTSEPSVPIFSKPTLAPSPKTPTSTSDSTTRKLRVSASTATSISTPAKRPRVQEDDYFADVPRGPRHLESPRADKAPERVSKSSARPSERWPYIFVSAKDIEVKGENINHMERMLINKHVVSKKICADREGYYVVFEGSYDGDQQARRCFDVFRCRDFMGKPLNMELFPRRSVGAFSSS